MDDRTTASEVEYGVTQPHVTGVDSGLDFVRAIFDGRLPAPPNAERGPFDSTAETGHWCFTGTGISALQSNRIGAWRLGAILLIPRWGLRSHRAPAGPGYTTLEFKISFIKGRRRIPALCAPRARR